MSTNQEVASNRYCLDPYSYKRRRTHEVMVGNVGVGGNNPIRVQSMTTTRTKDVESTVNQIVSLARVGCEIVRVTTPTPADAKAIKDIKKELQSKNIHIPIVADVHFSPHAAMEAALWADKVRINPGNFADTKLFHIKEYTDEEYAKHLEKIAEKLYPLVMRCKERGISMRIGTNHGSLSDRIMSRYGDTPLGMVESALEFVRMCEEWGYKDIILSMKASNPKVMIAAYRLLAASMLEYGMTYPFHLGVTEAGNGEDGRIKSAIGIGTLLEDGIGDTVRVSLTEDPENEIPFAYELVKRYAYGIVPDSDEATSIEPLPDLRSPFDYSPRPTRKIFLGEHVLGANNPPLVLYKQSSPLSINGVVSINRPVGRDSLRADALSLEVASEKDRDVFQTSASGLQFASNKPALIATLRFPVDVEDFEAAAYMCSIERGQEDSLFTVAQLAIEHNRPLVLELIADIVQDQARVLEGKHDYSVVDELISYALKVEQFGVNDLILALRIPDRSYRIRAYRLLDSRLRELGKDWNLLLTVTEDDLIDASIGLGSLLCDGIGSMVSIEGNKPYEEKISLVFNILQASGARISKAEFIACPSCGRTLFDLQTTTEKIKSKTGHLKGVKIAVMGCIVNGLGELADADFGYMGSGEGKVNLFVGKTCVEKNVPEEIAADKLVDLIKAHGRWIDPPDNNSPMHDS